MPSKTSEKTKLKGKSNSNASSKKKSKHAAAPNGESNASESGVNRNGVVEKNNSSVKVWPGVELEAGNKKKDYRLPKMFSETSGKKAGESAISWLVNENDSPDAWKQINRWHRSGFKSIVSRKNSGTKKKKNKKTTLRRLANEILEAVVVQDLHVTTFGDAAILLAACHWIRVIAQHCEYEDWNACVTKLLEISQAAESTVDLDPSVYQILAIEVPLAVAFQIPETEDYRGLVVRCAKRLSLSVADMLDHDGWPHGRYLSEFGVLVASWIRSHAMLTKMDVPLEGEAAVQFEWMVRQVMRMLRADRTLAFSPPGSHPTSNSFLKTLLKVSNDPSDKPLIKRFVEKKGDPKRKSGKIDPSNISEWAMATILRSQWDAKSPRVSIDYSSGGCRLEIGSGLPLIDGSAMPSVSLNGVPMPIDGDFELVCEERTDEIQFIELEVRLGRVEKGATLSRQFLLSRTEQFLLVADAIVPDSKSQIDYRCNWPLANSIEGMHESETREVYLKDKKIRSLVLPLALPEWKVGLTDDRLSFEDRHLSLVQSINGSGLYAPLFFDLSPKRSKLKRTWRQLTVGENLQIVPRDVACAYRVQLDRQQWFFYRIVSSLGNRTFLGENFAGEFSFNRFDKKGNVTSLIQIDATE